MNTIILEIDKKDRNEILEILATNNISYSEQNEEKLTGVEVLIGIIIPFTTMIIPIIVDIILDKKKSQRKSHTKRAILTKDGRFTLENYERAEAVKFLNEYKKMNKDGYR